MMMRNQGLVSTEPLWLIKDSISLRDTLSRRHQRHRGDDFPGVAHGGGAHLLPLLNGGLDALGASPSPQ